MAFSFRHLPVSDSGCTANFEQLATFLPSVVSSLPASAVDGQEVFYQNATMAGAGVVWHLKYRAASSSAHKWEFVGGSDMWTVDAIERSLESGAAFTTQSPNTANAIEVPIAGEYDIGISMWYVDTGALSSFVPVVAEVAKPTTAIITYGVAVTIPGGSTEYASLASTVRLGGMIAGTSITPATQISVEKVTYKVIEAQLRLRPVRVG